jgi:glycosyltransferase involved in cell wall biosynthesis
MKIAIVQDGLMCKAGGEQVARCFSLAFPGAPIYTLCYQANLTFPFFENKDVRTSWLQNLAKTDIQMKNLFFPLGVLAMTQLNLTEFDVVLMSSTHCAKYVKVSSSALVIDYCHTPFRLVWEPNSYAQYTDSSILKKGILNIVRLILRKIDFYYAQRVDYFIANTQERAIKITEAYKPKNEVIVISPPTDCSRFEISDNPKKYYLVVSRLEYYKRVDLAIDAFNQLGYNLIVVGAGSMEKELKDKAKSNINFISDVSNEDLAKLYADCIALVFPQHEDYGITPLEANASGRPVIAYGKGGILTTMTPYTNDASKATSLFFDSQTVECLIDSINEFEGLTFDTKFIKAHTDKFNEEIFVQKVQNYVLDKYRNQ